MLETLAIKNIAVIDSTQIPFKKGLNILSGETGAGKSIVIEAISLILGSRANSELIRAGCDEAVVEGLFDTSELPWLKTRLGTLGFASDTDELLIKRIVHRAGKHRIYVNGELATLSILQQLCEGLVDLCGQHEHQSLIRPATQLELLDRYGNLEKQTKEFGARFGEWKKLLAERDLLEKNEADRSKRADFLSFQIQELKAAELISGEDEKLHHEKILLQSSESRVQAADGARESLENEEGALKSIRVALQKLRALNQIDDRTVSMKEGLDRALAEVEDVSVALSRYLSSSDLNPERLVEVQDRLSLLADLRRKYGSSVDDMIGTLVKLESEFSTMEKTGEKIAALSARILELETELRKIGKKLSGARKKVAGMLGQSVTGEIKDLKMGDALFSVELTERTDPATWNESGADQIQFQVQTNRGEIAKPLGKIASGGELSRLMLGIRRVIADRGGIGVYLFDEIDAGIGGQTAFQVGKKLKSVAAYNQVICITHLPQVASFANHHLVVRKSASGKRTMTEVVELGMKERKEELARMLGGPELTKKSLENAAELMQLAR